MKSQTLLRWEWEILVSITLAPPTFPLSGYIGDKVFSALEEKGMTASGGRIHGVGIGGFLLGGGYSYLTDEVSLSVPLTSVVDGNT